MMSRVDESLLCGVLLVHSKTTIEALFLEWGQILIKYIYASRQLNYLNTLQKRNQNFITRKLFGAQKFDPKKHDVVQQIEADKDMIQLCLNDQEI